MAPKIIYPEEIDLFTLPHSRMKELVNKYTRKVQCVDFRDCHETFALLKELYGTLYEFKSHEYIENLFIMDQLKNRLKQKHIYNSAVCDCHNDNRLSKILNLVKNAKHLQKSSINERLHFGAELQKTFTEFVQQFLPHMEEEENIFQPLLVEYFDYEELRTLKEVVIEQHELLKYPQYQEKVEFDVPETDQAIKDFRDIDSDVWSLSELFKEEENESHWVEVEDKSLCESDDVLEFDEEGILDLPTEVIAKIFSYLMPPDRGRCAKTCSRFFHIIYSFVNWKSIYPVQWARGIWCWEDVQLHYEIEDNFSTKDSLSRLSYCDYDEDADIDESGEVDLTCLQKEHILFEKVITYLLPKVGHQVQKIVLDAGKGITSTQIRKALLQCPNVIYLSVAYTSFDYRTLKGVWNVGSFSLLRHLDLEGCVKVDDNCLYLLSECLSLGRQSKRRCKVQVCLQNSNDCETNCSTKAICPYLLPAINYGNSHYNMPNFGGGLPSECPFWENSIQYLNLNSEEINNEVEIEDLHYFSKPKNNKASLETLNLSGCCNVTDQGLASLFNKGLLQNLTYLNLSSCFMVTGKALQIVVGQCPKLKPENLTYCNSITDGPYPTLANGCDNLEHPAKVCCLAL